MRIYKGHEQETFVHVRISRHGETTKRLLLIDAEQFAGMAMVWNVLKSITIKNPFDKGNRLVIKIHEKKGKVKSKVGSITVQCLSVEQVYEAITNHLNKKDEPRKIKN